MIADPGSADGCWDVCMCTKQVATLHLQDLCSTCDSEWWGSPIVHRKTSCVTPNLKLYQRPRWERRDNVTQSGRHHSEAQRKSFFLTSLMHRPSCWTHFWAELVWGRAFTEDQECGAANGLCATLLMNPRLLPLRGGGVFLRLKMIVFIRFICWTSPQLGGIIGHAAEFVLPSWCCTALPVSLQVDDT